MPSKKKTAKRNKHERKRLNEIGRELDSLKEGATYINKKGEIKYVQIKKERY
jgi:hypothetical protein